MKRPPGHVKTRVPLELRFWINVHFSPTCWEWMGARNKKGGYGVMGRTIDHKRKQEAAHRLAYEMEYGAIPNGLLVCHHCDIEMPRAGRQRAQPWVSTIACGPIAPAGIPTAATISILTEGVVVFAEPANAPLT